MNSSKSQMPVFDGNHCFIRVAVVVPEHRVGAIEFNTGQIILAMQDAEKRGAQLALFPELAITSYSCGDLFYQSELRESALHSLMDIAEASKTLGLSAVVGLPFCLRGRLYNCAAFINKGKVLGLIPKIHLPCTGEFYEERWFTSGKDQVARDVKIGEVTVPFGVDLLFQAINFPTCLVGIEICEDLWAVQPPSGNQALGGATILLNPSASNETLGKASYRRDLVTQQSARCLAAYAYASAGPGESSMDTVYSGHSLIAENGSLLSEGPRFQFETAIQLADIDVERLQNERLRNSSYSFDQEPNNRPFRKVQFELGTRPSGLLRRIHSLPFVPSDLHRRAEHCKEIFAIQTCGLAKRLRHTGCEKVVIGVSGGLDSTLALLVAAKAFDRLGLPRQNILAVTMPGFGTTPRTRGNAERLVLLLGAEFREIAITAAVQQHFKDIGHDETKHDIVYENAQARERTQILMDLANGVHGLVVGTGDLSEAALGWCTFNGDHMSMYHVNSGVPKTLVRYLIDWALEAEFSGETSVVLRDISNTPISPELLPLDAHGNLQQKTEETVGPYELHDFYLYYFVRHHFAPAKILYLATHAFQGAYSRDVLEKWWAVFLHRFMSQQFKRSSLPDGPKVGSVALSPRADWRMPSDVDINALGS